jgi:hypothetical protein
MELAESTYYRDPKVSRKERDEQEADIVNRRPAPHQWAKSLNSLGVKAVLP